MESSSIAHRLRTVIDYDRVSSSLHIRFCGAQVRDRSSSSTRVVSSSSTNLVYCWQILSRSSMHCAKRLGGTSSVPCFVSVMHRATTQRPRVYAVVVLIHQAPTRQRNIILSRIPAMLVGRSGRPSWNETETQARLKSSRV